jgi:hypothetical protein
MEDIAVTEFRHAAQWVHQGELQFVVMWLDGVVSSLQSAIERWQRVGDDIQNVLKAVGDDPQVRSWVAPWSADASMRVEVLSRLLSQVVDWVVWCCLQVGWNLTSPGLENVQKCLASRR